VASRTKQKEEARARRLAEEQARTERARRDRRLKMVSGVVLGALALVAVAIAISSSGGSKSSGLKKGAQASSTVASVEKLLSGIPQSGARLGNPKAPVTLSYYGDLECPICQQFTLSSFPQLVANEVRSGKVQVNYKAFQTATPDATTFQTQQVAALAAGNQQRFWNYVELFYHEQGQEDSGYVTEPYLQGLAKQVPGLNLVKWQADRNDPALVNQVHSDMQSGTAIGVTGTPTLIFKGPKGQATPSAAVPSYAQLQQTIQKVA
jgi:protein-disulfide isomerase